MLAIKHVIGCHFRGMKKFPKNVKITDYLRKKAHFCRYFQFFCKRRREKKSAGFKQAEKGCRFCPVFFSLYLVIFKRYLENKAVLHAQ